MNIKTYLQPNGAMVTFEKTGDLGGLRFRVVLQSPDGSIVKLFHGDNYYSACEHRRAFVAIARNL